MSGGHVLRVAAGRDDIAAVIAMTPLTSGAAVSRAAVAHRDARLGAEVDGDRAQSRVDVARGRRPTMMPLVAHPREPGG